MNWFRMDVINSCLFPFRIDASDVRYISFSHEGTAFLGLDVPTGETKTIGAIYENDGKTADYGSLRFVMQSNWGEEILASLQFLPPSYSDYVLPTLRAPGTTLREPGSTLWEDLANNRTIKKTFDHSHCKYIVEIIQLPARTREIVPRPAQTTREIAPRAARTLSVRRFFKNPFRHKHRNVLNPSVASSISSRQDA
jgi:hypothetical protein